MLIFLEFGYKKNPPKRRVTRPLNLDRAHSRSLTNTSCNTRLLFGLEFGETEILADLPSYW
jgi:hypothetical protein